MTESGERVLQLAMRLSREDRVELAAKLVHSVHAFTQAEAAWRSAIEARARRVLAELGATPAQSGVAFDLEAEADLETAVAWYQQHHPAQVSTFLGFVTDAIKRIRRKPQGFGELDAVTGALGVRRIFLREFPYALAFLTAGQEIRVLAVAHTYRAPEEHDITISALVSVEEWLAANGLRALCMTVGLATLAP